jgi:hypothetical protein
MKNTKTLVILTAVAALLATCVSTEAIGFDLSAGPDESEIIIGQKSRRFDRLLIFIDGELNKTIGSGDKIKFILPNGQYTLSVRCHLKGTNSFPRGVETQLNAASERYIYNVELPDISIGRTYLILSDVNSLESKPED